MYKRNWDKYFVSLRQADLSPKFSVLNSGTHSGFSRDKEKTK